jgi:hypothetical protein
MRFVSIYRTVERSTPPTSEEMAAMGKFIDEIAAAGVLLDTGGCLPSAMGARVRREGGKTTVTDGPFAESKEVIAGYAILQTATKEEAIAWTKRFLEVAGDGESEIRPLFEAGDCVGAPAPELREAEARRQARMAANA